MTKKTFEFQLVNFNKKCKSIVDKHLKMCCWLHNYLLKELKKRGKNNEKQLTEYQLIKLIAEIKKEHQFLKEVQSQVLQKVAKQVLLFLK